MSENIIYLHENTEGFLKWCENDIPKTAHCVENKYQQLVAKV